MGRRKKLSSGEKIAAGVFGIVMFPLVLTWETAKLWDKKHSVHKRRRRK
jgi:hypothetical protein